LKYEVSRKMTDGNSKPCWICGGPDAKTREHKIKRTDLKQVFGDFDQADPHYWMNGKDIKTVGSLKADILKMGIRICNECNSARTQPHDFAWERLSTWLNRLRPTLRTGTAVRGNRVFGYNTRRQMTDAHLFFVKLFGGMLAESGNCPIPIEPFAKAIMTSRAHPEMYLQIDEGDGTVGWSNLTTAQIPSGHYIAVWLYRLDRFFVHVIYARAGAPWEKLGRLWHPKFGTNKMTARDFSAEE
jgi:hypothetical protein